MLCPALESSEQGRHGSVRLGPEECHKDDQKAEAPILGDREGSGNTGLELFRT